MVTKKSTTRIANFFTYFILILVSIGVLFPILWMFSTSLKTAADTFKMPPTFIPSPVSFEAYVNIWTNYSFTNYFINSIWVVGVSTLISMVFSCLAGYGVTRFNFKGKSSFLTFLLVTYMFPTIMMLIPFYRMLSQVNLINTTAGLIFPYISFTVPFCTWMMKGYFATIPGELDDSAKIDGCGQLRAFWHIILPLALPGLVATGIYSFIHGWNEYMFALTLVSSDTMKTVPVGIGQLSGEYQTSWNDMMAASTVAGVPVTIIFMFLQKYLVGGLAAGAVKT